MGGPFSSIPMLRVSQFLSLLQFVDCVMLHFHYQRGTAIPKRWNEAAVILLVCH